MGNPSVKASVVIPVYNKAPYVEGCLRGIMTHDFPAFEAIALTYKKEAFLDIEKVQRNKLKKNQVRW